MKEPDRYKPEVDSWWIDPAKPDNTNPFTVIAVGSHMAFIRQNDNTETTRSLGGWLDRFYVTLPLPKPSVHFVIQFDDGRLSESVRNELPRKVPSGSRILRATTTYELAEEPVPAPEQDQDPLTWTRSL